jgi:hypothetical protein
MAPPLSLADRRLVLLSRGIHCPIDLLRRRAIPQHVFRPEGEDDALRAPRQLGQAGHGARGVAGLEADLDAVETLWMVCASPGRGGLVDRRHRYWLDGQSAAPSILLRRCRRTSPMGMSAVPTMALVVAAQSSEWTIATKALCVCVYVMCLCQSEYQSSIRKCP